LLKDVIRRGSRDRRLTRNAVPPWIALPALAATAGNVAEAYRYVGGAPASSALMGFRGQILGKLQHAEAKRSLQTRRVSVIGRFHQLVEEKISTSTRSE
jgi:hypothetical protein